MSVHFHKYENQTLTDKRLTGTTRTLYDFMLAQSNLHGNDFIMSIAELAEGIMRSSETTRSHLGKLIVMGFVTRILRRDFARRKWNLKSRFIVHPIAQGTLPQEQSELVEYATQGGYSEKTWVLPPKNSEGKEKRESIREDKDLTLKREAETSPIEIRKLNSVLPDLTGVPDILIPTAEHWLAKTGKTFLSEQEISQMRELLDRHYPTRINREINRVVDMFLRQGKDPARQSFSYVYACLKDQRSLKPTKKAAMSDKKAPQTTHYAEQEEYPSRLKCPLRRLKK